MKISILGKIHRILLGKYYPRSNRFIHLMKGKIKWIFPAFGFLLKNHSKKEKRILLIWDFQTVPCSIGDLVLLHERAQILRLIHKVDKIDFCFVCNPKHNVRNNSLNITPDNLYTHFPQLVSTVYLNPHIGNFFIFDSHNDLENFISNNIERYHLWPNFKEYIGKYDFAADNQDIIQKFYLDYGFIPHLDYRPNSLKWAYSFYKKNVFPKFPVILHLRNNPLKKDYRNADLNVWIQFLKKANKKFTNVKFILIGAKGEIDSRFRHLSNVLIAKDYKTTVEQDLILAATSLMFMGTSSGPMAGIWFSKKPYSIFRWDSTGFSITIPPNKSLCFATENQILNWKPETEKDIMEQFSNAFSKIDKNKWKKEIEKTISNKKVFASKLKWAE